MGATHWIQTRQRATKADFPEKGTVGKKQLEPKVSIVGYHPPQTGLSHSLTGRHPAGVLLSVSWGYLVVNECRVEPCGLVD